MWATERDEKQLRCDGNGEADHSDTTNNGSRASQTGSPGPGQQDALRSIRQSRDGSADQPRNGAR